MTTTEAALLKLVALEADDLPVISAHLQDAVACAQEIAYLPAERRLAMVVNRFDWMSGNEKPLRRRTGVRFDRVSKARLRNLDLKKPNEMLNLLAVEFTPGDAPSGTITLYFSGDAAIQLQVECVEAALTDLGPEWTARGCPQHDTGA